MPIASSVSSPPLPDRVPLLAPAVAAVIGVLVTIFFAPGLLFGRVPIFRDLLVLVLPLRQYAATAVRSGELPLWTPDLFFGAPFLANYQSAVFYPPSVILYLAPFPTSLSLFLAFHLFVAGTGMASYLERRSGLRREVAVFGGTVFAFGGYLTSLVPLTNQLQVAAWLPWVLLAAAELLSTGRRRSFLALTLLLALQLLGGAPEATLLTLGAVAAVTARSLWRDRSAWQRIPAVASAGLLAAGLAAFQLLPTAEYMLQTNRADILPFSSVTAESLEPRSLLQLLLPHSFDDGAPGFLPEAGVPLFWSLYVGIAPAALALAVLGRRLPVFWITIFASATALALGPHLPLLPLAYSALPRIVGWFRFPAKFFLLAHLALAVLAAQGLGRALEAPRDAKKAIFVAASLVVLGFIAFTFAMLEPKGFLDALGYTLSSGLSAKTYIYLAAGVSRLCLRLAALAFTTGALLWLFARGRLARSTVALLLVALTFAELFPMHQASLVFTDWSSLDRSVTPKDLGLEQGMRIFHFCTDVPSCLPANAPGLGPWGGTVRVGESVEKRGRSLWAALVPDVPLLFRLGAVAGSDGFSTRDQRMFYRALALLPREDALHLLGALGVQRLIGPSPLEIAGELPIHESREPPIRVYRLSASAPRVYLAERVFAASDPEAALWTMASANFRPGRDAVLIGGSSLPVDPTVGGRVIEATLGHSVIRAQVSLPAAGLLVVSDTWFPGWEAMIDGQRAKILRVNGFLRGVLVPEGIHQVEMLYRPKSFAYGCEISILVAALLVGVAVVSRRWSRTK